MADEVFYRCCDHCYIGTNERVENGCLDLDKHTVPCNEGDLFNPCVTGSEVVK